MDSWLDQVNSRARLLIDQIIAARLAAGSTKADLGWLEQQYRDKLEQLYANEYAVARLRDLSDLVVRAEGPGADHDAPSLKAFTWLSDHVRRQLTKLGEAVLPFTDSDSRAVARKLAWSFTGYAPGSIMLGFALHSPPAIEGFENADEAAFSTIRSAAQSIAAVPQYVGDTELSGELADHIPDPALRDAAVVAAWQLAPTAQSGIHTVEVASRDGQFGSLSLRERLVLKQSVEKPLLRKSEVGSFEGNMRAADLDKHRVILRAVRGIGSIRCIIADTLDADARRLFGGRVKVSGRYETDRFGRPRLLKAEKIEPALQPIQELPLK